MTVSRFFWLIVLIFAGYLLYLLGPILTPFLVAAVLAYLGDPLADQLERWRFKRLWAVVTVFAGFIGIFAIIILVLIPLLAEQINNIIKNIPNYVNWFQHTILARLPSEMTLHEQTIDVSSLQNFLREHVSNFSSFANHMLGTLKGPLGVITTWITYLFLIPVVAFYMLRDWDKMIAGIRALIPRKYKETACDLARKSDYVLGGFLRGQLMVMLGLGIIYAIGLTVVGLDMGIVIGLFAGLVSFVPYLGLIVGIAIAGVMSIVQFQDWLHPLGVVITFIVAQTIEGTILTPKFVGDRTGLHPIAVLFSVLAGGQLFGFMGILLALPAAAVINVFIGYCKENYLQSDVYREAKDEPRAAQEEQS